MDSTTLRTAWLRTLGPADLETLPADSTCRPEQLSAPAQPAVPLEEVSGYVPLEELGRGGFGVVYRAEQTSLGRDVALKLALSAAREAEFIQEACMHGQLEHPNIVPVHDLGRRQGALFLAMKLVEGRPWSRLLREEWRDDLDKNLAVLDALCQAVDYAHSRGLVHNDLKPANVLIGAFGEVQLTDWGLAVSLEEDPARPWLRPRSVITSPCGTPCYMPPELALGNGQQIGVWTDVYLLGGILLRILTGRPPHAGKTVWAAARDAAAGIAPSLTGVTSPALRAICRRALAVQPERRFPSAGALREALASWHSHRQSLTLTAQAETILAGCQERPALEPRERIRIYENFSRSLADFEQALRLWPENASARQGLQRTRRLATETALAAGDLGLAETHLPADDAELAARVSAARAARRHELASRQRLRRMVQLALVGVCLAGLVGLGYLLDSNARLRHTTGELQTSRQQVLAEHTKALQAEQTMRAARDAALVAESTALAHRTRAEMILDFAFSTLREKLAPLGQRRLLLPAARGTLAYFAELGEDADPERQRSRARALTHVATLLRGVALPQEALLPAEDALAILRQLPRSPETEGALLDALLELVRCCLAGGDDARALVLAQEGEARAIALASGDPDSGRRAAQQQRVLAAAWRARGQLESARVVLQRAVESGDRASPLEAFAARGALLELLAALERHDEARALARQRLERAGQPDFAGDQHLHLGQALADLGRLQLEASELAQAERSLRAALAELELDAPSAHGPDNGSHPLRLRLAELAIALGRPEDAGRQLELAREQLRAVEARFPGSLLPQARALHTAAGRMLVEQGALADARAAFATAAGLPSEPGFAGQVSQAALAACAAALAAITGDDQQPRVEARARLEQLTHDAAPLAVVEARAALGEAWRGLAEVLWQFGDAATAVTLSGLALQVAPPVEAPPVALHHGVRLLLTHAAGLRSLGRLEEAHACLEFARQCWTEHARHCPLPDGKQLFAALELERAAGKLAAGDHAEALACAARAEAGLVSEAALAASELRTRALLLQAEAWAADGQRDVSLEAYGRGYELAQAAAQHDTGRRWLRLQAACLAGSAGLAEDPALRTALTREVRALLEGLDARDPRIQALFARAGAER